MTLTFLIPLFTSLVTGYIFQKCTDEVGNIAGLFAVINLVLSLVLAPWQILLLLLIFVIITTKKLLQQNEHKMKLAEYNQEKLH